jgi:uncharacterized protein (TIGR03083 family)
MTATCHRRDLQTYCDLVEAEIEHLARVIESADWAAPVPTCPDWTTADLVEHVGGVHRWAGHQVQMLAQERVRPDQIDLAIPADHVVLPAWLSEGKERLLTALRNGKPDAPMWAWGSDKHVRFWPRRMLHETTVHRADAEIAAGIEPLIEDGLAVDGVDEFLDNLAHASYFRPDVDKLRGAGERVQLRANGTSWIITLLSDRFAWTHDVGDAGVTVEAPPGDLLLFVYGRRKVTDPVIKVAGDHALLDRWIANSAL